MSSTTAFSVLMYVAGIILLGYIGKNIYSRMTNEEFGLSRNGAVEYSSLMTSPSVYQAIFHQNGIAPDTCDKVPLGIKSNEMIGLVYPPKLGPIRSPIQIPNQSECASPFTAIYPDGYQVFYGAQPNLG